MADPALSHDAALPAAAVRRAPRILVIDWLRGVAVVLMFMAHGFDSWLDASARATQAYQAISFTSGLPSRLFLFLVGVSQAIGFESAIARGTPAHELRAKGLRRGLFILLLAYLFRFQEFALGGFRGQLVELMKVDILNCIAASLLVVAVVAVPRRGRPAYLPAAIGVAVLLALGNTVGLATFPSWLPRPLTSYLGGARPMAWFPVFPWTAWVLAGVIVGHLWLRNADRPARTFALTGTLGVAFMLGVQAFRAAFPQLSTYPNPIAQAMGPGSFFFRLGMIMVIVFAGDLVCRHLIGQRFSVLVQLGRTSLLLYWVHINLVYGGLARPLRQKLSLAGATVAIALLTLLMLGLSLARTRYLPDLKALGGLWRRLRLTRDPARP